MGIKTSAGVCLIDLLCGQLAIQWDYIDKQVQTVFVNGRVVDRLDQVVMAPDMVIALSAAMPGLMGATLRKGSLLACFRKDISLPAAHPARDPRCEITVTLKFFNLVAKALGPRLLAQGVWITGTALGNHIKRLDQQTLAALASLRWNRAPISVEALSRLPWRESQV
ncbi:MAG: hypothetical protein HKP58_13190, partial [Desulfatitalea sp.]|nr:hypothetical protein [Desulfatitalea sp.]NNK01354.1 hypothetical protein [Desulfatitalea sp.]